MGSSKAKKYTLENDIVDIGKYTPIEIDITEVAQGFTFLALDYPN